MHTIWFRYGSSFFFSFTAVLGIGLVLAFILTNRQAAHTRLSDWVDGWLIIMVFAWLGARSGFVAANWEYYRLRPSEIWLLWDGGLSYHGALLGGCIGLGLWCIWGKRPWFPYAAQFAPALALISAFGWAACWFDGCAYGLPTTLSLLAADLPDEFGVFAVRYQTQLLGIILSLGVFTAVLALQKRWPPARLFWLSLLSLSLIQLGLTFLRGDTAVMLGNYRLDTLLNLLLLLVCVIGLIFERVRG